MKVSPTVFPALIGIALFAFSAQKELLTPDNDVCRLFKDGVVLRQPGTCSKAIVCKNFTSAPHKDCGSQIWDLGRRKCVESTKDAYCGTACRKNSPYFVNDKKNCSAWNRCDGSKELSRGVCSNGLLFDQQKQLCVYPEQSDCVASYEFCDVVPPNVPFKDEDNCHKYYMCSKAKLTTKECPTGQYFDARKGACTAKAQVKCYRHPYPEEVCGNRKLVKRGEFVSDRATCRGYFYCRVMPTLVPDTQPIWGQCPVNSFFEPVRQVCAATTDVKCAEDRCDGVGSGKTLSSRPGCQHYLVCENNYTIREEYCGDGLYFDERQKTCVKQKNFYDACS